VFRVFKPKLFVLQRIFFRPTETSGVDSEIFCDQNFGISNPYEISVERKPEKFSKFRAKINYCKDKTVEIKYSLYSKSVPKEKKIHPSICQRGNISLRIFFYTALSKFLSLKNVSLYKYLLILQLTEFFLENSLPENSAEISIRSSLAWTFFSEKIYRFEKSPKPAANALCYRYFQKFNFKTMQFSAFTNFFDKKLNDSAVPIYQPVKYRIKSTLKVIYLLLGYKNTQIVGVLKKFRKILNLS
jgi:hypothetical protein